MNQRNYSARMVANVKDNYFKRDQIRERRNKLNVYFNKLAAEQGIAVDPLDLSGKKFMRDLYNRIVYGFAEAKTINEAIKNTRIPLDDIKTVGRDLIEDERWRRDEPKLRQKRLTFEFLDYRKIDDPQLETLDDGVITHMLYMRNIRGLQGKTPLEWAAISEEGYNKAVTHGRQCMRDYLGIGWSDIPDDQKVWCVATRIENYEKAALDHMKSRIAAKPQADIIALKPENK